MQRPPVVILIAVISCAVVIAVAFIWISNRHPALPHAQSSIDCTPVYDAAVISKQIKENDDPQLFAAFQELPIYAMPDCVKEAYSLTWIPSFHAPVHVRLWRSGDRSYMVAKELDTKGWLKLGHIKETSSRTLTQIEWQDFTDLLNSASFWEIPSTVNEASPNDGAVWLLDGLRDNQYHWVRRRIPIDQYSEICKRLITLSGLETAHASYLP
jgi:hypothetical protein